MPFFYKTATDVFWLRGKTDISKKTGKVREAHILDNSASISTLLVKSRTSVALECVWALSHVAANQMFQTHHRTLV